MVLVLESAAPFLILTGVSCDFRVSLVGFSSLLLRLSAILVPSLFRAALDPRQNGCNLGVLRATMVLLWFLTS